VNIVGEPCARKPHARFDEGRLARHLAEPVAYSTRLARLDYDHQPKVYRLQQ
jgi:hypothetical protein